MGGEGIGKAFALAGGARAEVMGAGVGKGGVELERVWKQIGQMCEGTVGAKRSLVGTSAARLNALSPLATLSRGYAVARDSDGRALTSARHFAPGLDFELLLHDGSVNAETKSVE